jgi:hypothetical protein
MTIYRRTPAGAAAALNSRSTLPRKMRTLLIAVNGQTDESTYASGLSSFGDVPVLLRSLLDAGLLEVVSAAQFPDAGQLYQPLGTAGAGFSGRDGEAFRNESNGLAAAGTLARSGNTFPSLRAQVPTAENIDMSGWAALQQTMPPGDRPSFSPAGLVPTTVQHQLREVISLMSDFVTTHLPAQSLEIVLGLEDLRSIEHAIASLQDYEALISPAGEPARRHLAELRKALATP